MDFKPKYLRSLHHFLSDIFDYCIRFHGLTNNPCTIAGSIGKYTSKRKFSIWTYPEYLKVSEEITDISTQTILAVLFWTGIRKGELFGLQWRDFNALTSELTIERNYQRLHGQALILPPKTESSHRTIILPDHVCAQLADYRAVGREYQPTDFIFNWSKRKLEAAIQRACEKTGVKRIRVHDLRHSHATMLVNLNVDIASISKRLGHSSTSMTLEIYAHVYDDSDRHIANKLNSLCL